MRVYFTPLVIIGVLLIASPIWLGIPPWAKTEVYLKWNAVVFNPDETVKSTYNISMRVIEVKENYTVFEVTFENSDNRAVWYENVPFVFPWFYTTPAYETLTRAMVENRTLWELLSQIVSVEAFFSWEQIEMAQQIGFDRWRENLITQGIAVKRENVKFYGENCVSAFKLSWTWYLELWGEKYAFYLVSYVDENTGIVLRAINYRIEDTTTKVYFVSKLVDVEGVELTWIKPKPTEIAEEKEKDYLRYQMAGAGLLLIGLVGMFMPVKGVKLRA
jgi:hypothetical protein